MSIVSGSRFSFIFMFGFGLENWKICAARDESVD